MRNISENKRYKITGMSCAACSARVEKAVSVLSGVDCCTVNLITGTMTVDGKARDNEIISAVEAAGYQAELYRSSNGRKNEDDSLASEVSRAKIRIISSLIFLLPLMYASMGHMIGLPLPRFILENHMAHAMIEMLLSTAVLIINQKFFINGVKGIIHRAPNMDTLVSLGSGASYVYSVFKLFLISAAYVDNDTQRAEELFSDLWFESAAMILVIITFGKMLEIYSKGKTTNALKGLMNLAPKTAIIIKDGKEIPVLASEIRKGDIFAVKPGQSIAADGIVIEGSSAVDESSLTGESIPVDKTVGDTVSGATVNKNGYLKCEAIRVGEETVLSQIIKTVEEASATKAPIARLADKVSGIFVPFVIIIAIVTAVVWGIITKDIGSALSRGISVLVISCPCALGLATPVAIMVGSGVGARHGILFKTAEMLEISGAVNTVVFDKTGTVTKGEPSVIEVISDDVEELLKTALALENKSEHPIAKAIVQYSIDNNINIEEAENFEEHHGNGVEGFVCGRHAFGGNIRFIEKNIEVDIKTKERYASISKEGKTPLLFALENRLLGIIAVSDTVREESAEAVAELHKMGIEVVMLTGDNENAAQAIADKVGITRVIAEVLPNDKENVIKAFCEKGKTAMVGDGINDAPALTRANVGIAIGSGSDIAASSAGIVLMNSRITDVPRLIKLSRATLLNIKQNLFWAFIYNIVCIPLAAGVYSFFLDIRLSPMIGAAAMSLSSICVVTNSLRLRRFKFFEKKSKERGKKQMKKTLKIEGMMCAHCEARVKKILEETEGVISVEVSHKDGTAVITFEDSINDSLIKKNIEDEGYKVYLV